MEKEYNSDLKQTRLPNHMNIYIKWYNFLIQSLILKIWNVMNKILLAQGKMEKVVINEIVMILIYIV